MTEFYDDYIDSYRTPARSSPSPPAPSRASDRGNGNVATWAKANANPTNYPPSRAPSRTGPPPTQALGLMRKHTRTQTAPSRASQRSSGYEQEEGYASGDYEEPVSQNLSKIRIKVHYQDDIRGMALAPTTSFFDFMDKLCIKFGATALDVKFKDEDGGKVSLKDDGDYEMAIETAKESAQGKAEGRLEIWCVDA